MAIKRNGSPSSINSGYLQEQARRRIEALASEMWTDYNSHDPGITILEVLAYAITDLGLRTQQPIENILAGKDNYSSYSAREALSNAPLTLNDYRRLLLGIDGVRDAQLSTVSADGVEGLYALRSFFDHGLNENWVEQEIKVYNGAGKLLFATRIFFVPPLWKNLSSSWFDNGSISSISVPTSSLDRFEDPDRPIRYFAKATVTIDSSERFELDTWIYTLDPVPAGDIDAQFRSRLLKYLRSRRLNPVTGDGTSIVGVYPRFRQRTHQLFAELNNIRLVLNRHRNLCEDWLRIEPLRIQQVAVCVTQLELQAHADPVDVLASIYFQLQQFIEPQLRPNDLATLLQDGKVAEDIFQGWPLPSGQGFILDSDLQGLERGNNLYVSDLLRIIMQVPGVFALSGLTLRSFVDRLEINRDVRNCLSLLDPEDFYTQLSLDDCDIQLFRQGVAITPEMAAVKQRVQQLRNEYIASFPHSSANDLRLPEVQAQDLESYYSIQNEFPQTYRLRQGEITADMPTKRKAQAKQLKSYLLLFEQLLANYCSQLANVHELFSISKQTERSYFYQPLYQVPAVRNLLQAFLNEQRDSALSWEDFTQNCNNYIKTINFAAEDQIVFRERRQRFVEHMMNRFGESFADYATWVLVNNEGRAASDLIIDQVDFLQNFPALSAERATAFDYSALIENEVGVSVPDVWNSVNVSGLEKRIAGLLGIPNCRRRSLARLFNIDDYREIYDEVDTDGIREGRFRFWNAPVTDVYDDGTIASVDDVDRTKYSIVLSSTKHYPMDAGLEEEARRVVEFGRQGKYYAVAQTEPSGSAHCKYYVNLLDNHLDADNPIARRIDYPVNRGVVEQLITEALHLMQGRYAEGMHLIEHHMLRPLAGSIARLAAIEMGSDGSRTTQFVKDPYSFQVSILLPGWAPRFQDAEFRVIVEQTLRREMPAHILPWIYWVDLLDSSDTSAPVAFINFEDAYSNWLQAINTSERVVTQDALIKALNYLLRQPYVTLTNRTAYRPFSFER